MSDIAVYYIRLGARCRVGSHQPAEQQSRQAHKPDYQIYEVVGNISVHCR